MIKDKSILDVIEEIARKLGIPKESAIIAYESMWECIKDKLKDYPKYNHLTEEEFNKLRTSFNIPSIGKLYTTWDKIESKSNRKRRNEDKNKED